MRAIRINEPGGPEVLRPEYPNVQGWKIPPPLYQRSFALVRRSAWNSLVTVIFVCGRRIRMP